MSRESVQLVRGSCRKSSNLRISPAADQTSPRLPPHQMEDWSWVSPRTWSRRSPVRYCNRIRRSLVIRLSTKTSFNHLQDTDKFPPNIRSARASSLSQPSSLKTLLSKILRPGLGLRRNLQRSHSYNLVCLQRIRHLLRIYRNPNFLSRTAWTTATLPIRGTLIRSIIL